MCFSKANDQMLSRIQESCNDEEKRRLLQEIDTCITCQDRLKQTSGSNRPCSCRTQQHIYLKNLYYFALSGRHTENKSARTQLGWI